MKIIINEDAEFAREVREAIERNEGYCCCALERSSDTKCMCKAFRDRIKAGIAGSCDCGLYEAVNDSN